MKFDLNFDSSFDININSSDLIGFSGFPQNTATNVGFFFFSYFESNKF